MRLQHQCVSTTRLSTRISVLAVRGAFLACVFAPLAHAAEKEAQDPAAGTASSLTGPPTPAQLSTLQGIRNAGLPAIQNTDLKTKRTSYDGGFGYNFAPQWDLSASYRHETNNGTKPVGVASSISTFESTLILPDLVDTSTDQYKLALNYTGDKGNAQATYHGTLGSNVNGYDNLPQSKRLNQFSLDADYAIATGHTLAAGYEFQKIERHCNGTWVECVDASSTRENALRAEWRAHLGKDISSSVRYTYARHTADYNSNAWSADSRDRTDTLGLTVRHENLMRGKLDVDGSLLYSRARTDIGARGGNYATNPATMVHIAATDLPGASSDSLELRLSGQYALDKSSSVRMLYSVKRLKTTDFAYDGTQFGALTTVASISEQSPRYTVHEIGISYVHAF
jgi:predicted porin